MTIYDIILNQIMNMIFKKGEVSGDFSKNLIKPLYKKDDKGECYSTIK